MVGEEQTQNVWDSVSVFERFPKLNSEMKEVGKKVEVVCEDDGHVVPASQMSEAYKKKGVKGIKAQDTLVLVVSQNGEKKEFWVNLKSFSLLRELKKIRESNGDGKSLKGSRIRFERLATNSPNEPNWKVEKV